jgi:hypothetical protein
MGAPGRAEAARSGVAVGVAVGPLFGVLDALASSSSWTTTLGQMVTPWVGVAAALGWRSRTIGRAVVSGGVGLVAADAFYNVLGVVLYGVVSWSHWLLWTGVAIVVGPVAGLLGWWARVAIGPKRIFSVAALAALCISEGAALWRHIDHRDAHATYVVVGVVGLAVPVLVLRRGRDLLKAFASTLVLALVATPVLEFGLGILGVVTPRR